MHELSIMQDALDLALERAREAQATRVHQLRLRVGALSGVVPEALQFAFEALRRDTLADNAELQIDSVPATFWCATCRLDFRADDLLSECPTCHNPSAELRSGRELELASMEIT